MNLNESKALKDIAKALNESVSDEPQKNVRPKGVTEWTFADWFGRDLTGETYDGDIDCAFDGLTSLEGAPKIVNGNFNCYNNQLTSLEGAPEKIGGGFHCFDNKLTSLKGAPKEVKGDFWCSRNQLTSLEDAPEIVNGSFGCSFNELTSLESAPEIVNGNFNCRNNQLTSLEGGPKEVKGDFDCSYNELTSLEGAPKEIGGDFYCHDNQLTSLEGGPKKVGGDFSCDDELVINYAKNHQNAPDYMKSVIDKANRKFSNEKMLSSIQKDSLNIKKKLNNVPDHRIIDGYHSVNLKWKNEMLTGFNDVDSVKFAVHVSPVFAKMLNDSVIIAKIGKKLMAIIPGIKLTIEDLESASDENFEAFDHMKEASKYLIKNIKDEHKNDARIIALGSVYEFDTYDIIENPDDINDVIGVMCMDFDLIEKN